MANVPPAALTTLLKNSGNRPLVARLKRRDAEAAGELSDRFSAVLFVLILNIVGDSGTAEDLLAEIFLEALNRVQAMPDSEMALGLWMLRLARNHALAFLQSGGDGAETRKGRDPLESPVLFERYSSSSSEMAEVEGMRKEFLKAGEDERLALELAWYEGLSFEQLSQKLGQPVEAVRASVEAVLERMRKASLT